MTARHLCRALLAFLAALALSCHESVVEQRYIPNPPTNLQVVSVTQTSVMLSWSDQSPNEQGFIVYMRTVTSGFSPADTTPANTMTVTISGLQAGSTYFFRVTAFNFDGESMPTAEVEAHTTTPGLPNPPYGVQATAISASIVRITWTDAGAQDSFLVQRRTLGAAWAQIGATADNWPIYFDSTTQAATRYYYRIGAKNAVGVSWSLDSADVTTPAPAVPDPPGYVELQIVLGTGVRVTWSDVSTTETGFEIGRSTAGNPLSVIGTVPFNTTTYMDSLGDTTGIYSYGARSINEFGHSAWTLPPGPADYRFCSSGIIPLCVGNYWQYRVDSVAGTDFDLYRSVLDVRMRNGTDFYLIGDGDPAGGNVDTLYHLRNFANGCHTLAYPFPDAGDSELLFRYPPQAVGSFYRCEGDCVLVVVGSPGTTVTIYGREFRGVLVYQRFFGNQGSAKYYVKPLEVGVVREIEYSGPPLNPVEVRTLNIMDYHIEN